MVDRSASTIITEIEPDTGTSAQLTGVKKVNEDGTGWAFDKAGILRDAPASPSPIKLYIATPAYGGMLHVSYLMSIMNLKSSGLPFVYDVIGNESLVQRARNMMVARFLKSDCTHMLFIDADIGFSPKAVERLMEGIRSGKDVVSTAYAKKTFKWDVFSDKVLKHDKGKEPADQTEPLCSLGLDYNINIDPKTVAQDNGFIRVLDTASGFMMISRDAFDKIAKKNPDWLVVNDIEHSGGPKIDKYHSFFDVCKDPLTDRLLSEDYGFCRRCQQEGIDIWVDVSVGLSHTGNNTFSGDISRTIPA